MNKNVINCAALLTIHSVLSNADRIKNNDEYFTNLHNALYNVIVEFAKYLKEMDIKIKYLHYMINIFKRKNLKAEL